MLSKNILCRITFLGRALLSIISFFVAFGAFSVIEIDESWSLLSLGIPLVVFIFSFITKDRFKLINLFFLVVAVVFLITELFALPLFMNTLLAIGVYYCLQQLFFEDSKILTVPRGSLSPKSWVFVLVSSLSVVVTLILWRLVWADDVQAQSMSLENLSGSSAISILIMVPFLNALSEEFLFRGVIWNQLESLKLKLSVIIIVQTLMFAFVHIFGMPSGFMGVALAIVFGAFVGLLRVYSKGLLAPVVAHFLADILIISILVR